MIKKTGKGLIAALFAMVGFTSFAQNKDVVDVAVGSSDHTTLVTAVKAAGLVSTLKSKGPFTIFAPNNAAFDKLPKETVERLLQPDDKLKLMNILTYHVVRGVQDANTILTAIKKGNGTATLTTVHGASLSASIKDGNVVLTDEIGRQTKVITTDLQATNGIIHVIDTVLLPKN